MRVHAHTNGLAHRHTHTETQLRSHVLAYANAVETHRLSDVEDLPPLGVEGHQPGRDEVPSPRPHPALQNLVHVHLEQE